MKFTLEARREMQNGGWCRWVVLADGRRFSVGVQPDKRVRIPFKPRGQNRGWTYLGFVRDERGREIWCDKVGGSLGARGLLLRAGLIEEKEKV